MYHQQIYPFSQQRDAARMRPRRPVYLAIPVSADTGLSYTFFNDSVISRNQPLLQAGDKRSFRFQPAAAALPASPEQALAI